MNRSCQRQTHGFETPAWRMISAVPQAFGRRQNDPRPPDMFLRAIAIRYHRRQSLAIRGTHPNTDPLAHDASSQTIRQLGIL
jgi:hypothetical protein